jgi:hypothetical protein
MQNFNIDSLTVTAKRDLIAQLRESIKTDKALAREAKVTAKAVKSAARIEKRNSRIAALEAKIEALRNPVGTKAIKANKKAGAVSVTKYA